MPDYHAMNSRWSQALLRKLVRGEPLQIDGPSFFNATSTTTFLMPSLAEETEAVIKQEQAAEAKKRFQNNLKEWSAQTHGKTIDLCSPPRKVHKTKDSSNDLDADSDAGCFDIEMELAAAMSVQEESQKRIATGQSVSSEPLVDFVGGAFAELNPFGWSGGVDDED